MKFGVGLQGRSLTPRFQAIKQIALRADTLGFHSLFVSDHLMHPYPVDESPMHYCHEAWTLITTLAAMTRNVKLAFSVLIPAFRRPSVLAKMSATLDIVSEGRLIMSLGAGYFKKEYNAYGIPWEKHDDRVEREREAAIVLKSLWTQPIANFHGKYYHIKDAVMEPKPIQQPHPPIWICGNSSKTMEVVADLADGWFIRGPLSKQLKENINLMKQTVKGRQMDYITAMGIPTTSKPKEIIAKIWEYADTGITLLRINFHNTKTLVQFAEKVLPTFNANAAN